VIETAGAGPSARFAGGEPAGGLTGPTSVVLVGVVTLAAALVSAITGHGFGTGFNLVYTVVVVYVAFRVHVEDRFVTVVAPPIIYALAVFVAGFFDSEETTHSLRRVIENTFVNVSLGAPWLVGATLVAIVVVILRGREDARRR
jgi:hypothetical protein